MMLSPPIIEIKTYIPENSITTVFPCIFIRLQPNASNPHAILKAEEVASPRASIRSVSTLPTRSLAIPAGIPPNPCRINPRESNWVRSVTRPDHRPLSAGRFPRPGVPAPPFRSAILPNPRRINPRESNWVRSLTRPDHRPLSADRSPPPEVASFPRPPVPGPRPLFDNPSPPSVS